MWAMMLARKHAVLLVSILLAWVAAVGSGGRVAKEPFGDKTEGSGVDFVLRNGATPEKHQIETMAGGLAVLDFDNDGKLDLYFSNGAPQPKLVKPDASWHNRLYRNLGDWRFEDVTAKAGVAGKAFYFGVAAADFDNDGYTDIFVAGMPESTLYRNLGDGTFQDVTATAGVRNRQEWPVGAGWFDYNNDGRLDLFVVNYVRWDPATEPFCGDSVNHKYRTYCHPKYYAPLPNTLFRNNGDGTFTDVSEESGILAHRGKGMGIAFGDYDGDGDLDVFVANDTVPNFLFRNESGQRFTEVAMLAGVALNNDGRALSSMGADFRDIDNDGLDDLFVTALANETWPLFRNLGKGLFLDITYPTLIGASTLPLSGWSNAILDVDNDGWKDLVAAAGDVQDNTEIFSSRTSRQRSLVLLNNGGKSFSSHAFGPAGLNRGAAFGDLDNDGAIDGVVSRLDGRAVLLRNDSPVRNWIGFRLRGTAGNRDAIGASIRVKAGDLEQWNRVSTAVGYACSSSTIVHFGLGDRDRVEAAVIRWPSGRVQRLTAPQVNRVVEIVEPE
jgi:hypothetical protein